MEVVLVAVGGAVGAVARYGVAKAAQPLTTGSFPLGILLVNLTGAFLLGFVFTYLLERSSISNELRTAVTVGVLGAYTTFSTFSLDTLHLIQANDWTLAILNVAVSVGGALLAVWAGQQLARV
jgi:CrcB protein